MCHATYILAPAGTKGSGSALSALSDSAPPCPRDARARPEGLPRGHVGPPPTGTAWSAACASARRCLCACAMQCSCVPCSSTRWMPRAIHRHSPCVHYAMQSMPCIPCVLSRRVSHTVLTMQQRSCCTQVRRRTCSVQARVHSRRDIGQAVPPFTSQCHHLDGSVDGQHVVTSRVDSTAVSAAMPMQQQDTPCTAVIS